MQHFLRYDNFKVSCEHDLLIITIQVDYSPEQYGTQGNGYLKTVAVKGMLDEKPSCANVMIVRLLAAFIGRVTRHIANLDVTKIHT